MSLLTKIFNLLNKKEKATFFLILFLTLINTLVEILGITAIIPLISITLKQDLSLFEGFLPHLLEFSKNENFIIEFYISFSSFILKISTLFFTTGFVVLYIRR